MQKISEHNNNVKISVETSKWHVDSGDARAQRTADNRVIALPLTAMAMAHTTAEVEHRNSAANHWSENNEQRRYPLTCDCHPASSSKYTSWNRHDKSVYSRADIEAVISAPFNPAASGSAVSEERPIARSPPPPLRTVRWCHRVLPAALPRLAPCALRCQGVCQHALSHHSN